MGAIKVPSRAEIEVKFEKINLTVAHLFDKQGKTTKLGQSIINYFEYRADILNRVIKPLLMDADEAKSLFDRLQKELKSRVHTPFNKQSQEKKNPAYFTGIINMLIDSSLKGLPCDFNPQELTTVTRNREPFRTLARRIDGAFPGPVDPLAVWEIKEYYYTTTFGSRVADGVYETLLDGMELEEIEQALREGLTVLNPIPSIQHLLMVDSYFTWWVKGRSYLCRLIDMLHMGYVDEVLFGKEVTTRLPKIVAGWVTEYRRP